MRNISERHSIKLNILADIACSKENDDDYLVFIDGDAFPIVDIMPVVKKKFKRHQLMAFCREKK